MIQATIRLFRAIPIEKREIEAADPSILSQTIPFGYVLDPNIDVDETLLHTINDLVGISGEQANATFHKSWEKVRSASIEQLVLEQLLHYITTYGFSALGVYDQDSVYIPSEKLDLPELEDDISLTFVRGLTEAELLKQIVKLGGGVALHQASLDDIMTIVKAFGYPPDFLNSIKNNELLARLCEFYGVVPEEPVPFLRYVLYRLTGTSLLIKNDELIKCVKDLDAEQKKLLDHLIADAPDNLASIFYRFKPLFLALKSVSANKNFFNRLRKRAVKLHKPLPVDYLNSVTEQIKRGKLNLVELASRIEKASVFRKVRLAYALHFRLSSSESIVYPVRNGTGWACGFAWPEGLHETTLQAFEIVMDSLTENLRPQVSGKRVYVPSHINYALPSSEKQFAGPFPAGSYVTTPKDTVFGIHWFNVNDQSIDLDLSLLSSQGKIGWDADYRSEDALFSGDITDAPRPKGATELFYVKNRIAPNLVVCNYYNFSPNVTVDTKILVAQEAPKSLELNYMVDVNRIVAKADVTITRKQTVLGLVATVDNETRFYFGNVSVGCGITSTQASHTKHAREFLTDKFTNGLDLKAMLERAGATVTENYEEASGAIDLSPENLTKSNILELFSAT